MEFYWNSYGTSRVQRQSKPAAARYPDWGAPHRPTPAPGTECLPNPPSRFSSLLTPAPPDGTTSIMSREERLAEFVGWAQQHITGDEKGQAQIFLDRLFQAFGHPGVFEVGGQVE